ncbi:MAG: hypothetical protein HOK54_16100 [Alphaproteobacteria bacterium]|nr:hypothetical protein [Alphaproteobacteria bacterium]
MTTCPPLVPQRRSRDPHARRYGGIPARPVREQAAEATAGYWQQAEQERQESEAVLRQEWGRPTPAAPPKPSAKFCACAPTTSSCPP